MSWNNPMGWNKPKGCSLCGTARNSQASPGPYRRIDRCGKCNALVCRTCYTYLAATEFPLVGLPVPTAADLKMRVCRKCCPKDLWERICTLRPFSTGRARRLRQLRDQ